MQKQSEELTLAMDEKLLPVTQEIKELKLENAKLKEQVAFLEKNGKKIT